MNNEKNESFSVPESNSNEPTLKVSAWTPQKNDNSVTSPSLADFLTSDSPNEPIEMEDEVIVYSEEEPVSEQSTPGDARVQKKMYGKKKKSEREKKPEKKPPALPQFDGILNKVRQKYAKNSGARTGLYCLIAVLSCMALFLSCLLMLAVYSFVMLVLLSCALLLGLLSIALIVCGIAGLCYGIVLIFTSEIGVALIEIGLATVAFGIITALCALIYELLTSFLPRKIRYLSRLFLFFALSLLSYVFGTSKIAPSKTAKEETTI